MQLDPPEDGATPEEPIYCPPECLPNLDNLIVEDGKPVDNAFIEKLYRLLTTPLLSSWSGPPGGESFYVAADVGVFFIARNPAIVPDVLFATGVAWSGTGNLRQRENRSYFVWERGKPPDVVIEIVSDRVGGEATYKFKQYARGGVPYYTIFDPENLLDGGVLRSYVLRGGEYEPLTEHRFPRVGLGLRLWDGVYEGHQQEWLRRCDLEGNPIPTPAERIEQQQQEIEQLRARLRELGAG